MIVGKIPQCQSARVAWEMQMIIARYRRLMSWRYKYSSSMFNDSSPPFSLVIHRRDV